MSIAIALRGDVNVLADADAVAAAVADWIDQHSREAVAARGTFSIALAGGTTPRAAYELLARRELDWQKWQVFFCDERACPPDDPQSNYAMAKSTLLDAVAIPQANIYRMQGESQDLDAAASNYADLLTTVVGDDASIPVLDCVLLGLGENGHTASLFSGDPSLRVTDTWCTRGRADYQPFDRLTLTFPAINAARHVVFTVTGASKHKALDGVVRGSAPASLVDPSPGRLHWFLDMAADA